MAEIERHDPFGGAFGAALAVAAGDLVVTTVSGVTHLHEGEPVFADTFDEQLRTAGRNVATELARCGCATTDIIDASVFINPDVEIDPGLLLDQLHQHVFGETAPALLLMRAASIYPASLIAIKITAVKSHP